MSFRKTIFLVIIIAIIVGFITTDNWIPLLIFGGALFILAALVGIIIGVININSKGKITIYIVENESKNKYISDDRFKQESELEQDETLH